MSRILALDPGVSTGWALFEKGDCVPVEAGVWVGRGETFFHRMSNVVDAFILLVGRDRTIETVVIEEPAVMMGSAKAVASTAEGSTIKLAMVTGALCNIVTEHHLYSKRDMELPVLVPVVQWKGNLPKAEVARRVERIIGPHSYKSHAIDALGIGLWYMGFLK